MFAHQFFGQVTEHLRGSGVDEVDDSVLVSNGNAIKNVLDDIFVKALQAAQLFFGQFTGCAHARFLQLALYGGRQAHQVVFHQIIVGAGFHGGHSHFFADRPRDQDEGQIAAILLH